jgi:DNA-binding IclR family transcriptional regulator
MPAQPGDEGTAGSRSVRRALEMFELMLRRGEPLSVAEIVQTLGIPKSSAYELVRTLAEYGYLEPGPASGSFGLGRKLYELGMAYRNQVDLLKEGGRVVGELCQRTGESVQFSVLEDGMMLVLLKEESPQPIRIISRIGSRVPVNWAAAGRLLVSDLDDEALRETLAEHVAPSPTGTASTDIDALIAQIRAFRAQGYGFELGEANAHAGCVAAPVTDGSGRCVAAISVIAPEQRLQVENRSFLIEATTEAARKLSRRLGAL